MLHRPGRQGQGQAPGPGREGQQALIVCGPVAVVETTRADYPAFWEILCEHGVEKFFAEPDQVPDLTAFSAWYGVQALYSLTGFDAEKGVVGGAYLDFIQEGYYASVNIFKRRGYLRRELVAAVMQSALPYLFERFDLEKIVGVTRVDNGSCLELLKAIGLTVDGVIRHHRRVRGEWTDYFLTSILREELCESTAESS